MENRFDNKILSQITVNLRRERTMEGQVFRSMDFKMIDDTGQYYCDRVPIDILTESESALDYIFERIKHEFKDILFQNMAKLSKEDKQRLEVIHQTYDKFLNSDDWIGWHVPDKDELLKDLLFLLSTMTR